jgi:hypothetical protein
MLLLSSALHKCPGIPAAPLLAMAGLVLYNSPNGTEPIGKRQKVAGPKCPHLSFAPRQLVELDEKQKLFTSYSTAQFLRDFQIALASNDVYQIQAGCP